MSRHRKFTDRKVPQYQVLTKCQPEMIDGLSLKFRDLHVTYRIMLDYTDSYVRVIETEQERHDKYLELAAALPTAARELQDLVRLMFSAHLSAYETILSNALSASAREGAAGVKCREL
jgi:hypothetical protein